MTMTIGWLGFTKLVDGFGHSLVAAIAFARYRKFDTGFSSCSECWVLTY